MNKKNNLPLFTLLVVGLVSSFTSNIYAQKTDSVKTEQSTKTCSGEKFVMPESISVSNNAFADYLKVAPLSRSERISAFSKLSNEQKASFVRVQFALQFVKRPNMTKEQRDFFLETLSKVSADLYDKGNPQKVAAANAVGQEMENKTFGLFAQKEAFEILEGLGSSKNEDVALLQKYEDLLKLGMQLRKRLVKEMPITEKVSIWKTQLAYHLATSSFNQEQKKFIVEIMPNIQSIFEASANLLGEEKTKYLEALESNIFKVFSKAEAYAVFMTIGIQNRIRDEPESLKQFNVGYTSQITLRPQIVKFNLSNISTSIQISENKSPLFLSALSSQAAVCTCRIYCDLQGFSCGDTFCRPSSSGCGLFDERSCTNRCQPD